MEVQIKLFHEDDTLSYNLEPKSTILNLKEKILENEGLEITRQKLFYNFVVLSNETKNLTKEFADDATFYLSLPTARAPKVKIESSEETFLLVGKSSDFKILPILPNVCETIKAGKFAVVRNQVDEENGSVVYFARRYIVQKNCQIKCIPDGKVVEIKGNGVEVELEGELKRFQMEESTGNLNRVRKYLPVVTSLITSVISFALNFA